MRIASPPRKSSGEAIRLCTILDSHRALYVLYFILMQGTENMEHPYHVLSIYRCSWFYCSCNPYQKINGDRKRFLFLILKQVSKTLGQKKKQTNKSLRGDLVIHNLCFVSFVSKKY